MKVCEIWSLEVLNSSDNGPPDRLVEDKKTWTSIRREQHVAWLLVSLVFAEAFECSLSNPCVRKIMVFSFRTLCFLNILQVDNSCFVPLQYPLSTSHLFHPIFGGEKSAARQRGVIDTTSKWKHPPCLL